MSDAKFTKLLDYETIKQQFGDAHDSSKPATLSQADTLPEFDPEESLFDNKQEDKKKPGLTGSRLRSYAFAVLTRKEYAKAELIEKLCLYAENRDEVLELVDELSVRITKVISVLQKLYFPAKSAKVKARIRLK